MHKKSLFFSLSVLLVLNFTLYAAAQETSSDMNITFLWAESTVRDSNGYLVAYLENFRIHIVDLVRFNQIIDANVAMAKAEVVHTEIFDEPHEWITITDTATYDQPTVHSTTALLTGFTEVTSQPYRYVPLVVFFAMGVGTILSKKPEIIKK